MHLISVSEANRFHHSRIWKMCPPAVEKPPFGYALCRSLRRHGDETECRVRLLRSLAPPPDVVQLLSQLSGIISMLRRCLPGAGNLLSQPLNTLHLPLFQSALPQYAPSELFDLANGIFETCLITLQLREQCLTSIVHLLSLRRTILFIFDLSLPQLVVLLLDLLHLLQQLAPLSKPTLSLFVHGCAGSQNLRGLLLADAVGRRLWGAVATTAGGLALISKPQHCLPYRLPRILAICRRCL
mmetsp:Transcript_99215/g.172157  ORF Transcript_99215/g.172157 Transcript_99215/m.172157 type:complete len:241 (-) Transcript_99215:1522-2244(-)